MNIKENLTCRYCADIFYHPITLICCGENICKHHIDELMRESSSNKFNCPFCSQENANQNFHCVKLIQNLIDMELHKFKLDPKYKTALHNLNKEIERLEVILKDPEMIIFEEISELKRQVDLDRESIKMEIDTQADELIQQLESYEKMFIAKYPDIVDFVKLNDLVESSRKKLTDFDNCLNLFSVENNERFEKTGVIEKTINILQTEFEHIKYELMSNLIINYLPVDKDWDRLLGKLIVEVCLLIIILILEVKICICLLFFIKFRKEKSPEKRKTSRSFI